MRTFKLSLTSLSIVFDQKLEECRELYENFEKLGKFEAQNNELAILSSEKTKLEDTLSIKEKEVSQLTESVINLEQALKRLQVYSPIEKIDQEIPYLSINTESIKSLSQEGWKISSQHKDRVLSIQNSKVALVSIIGEIGSGKSWVAGQLNFNRGWRNPPKSLSIHYACRSEGNWFGTLISSAWNEPIKPREKPLSTTDPQQNSNSQLMEIYKELTDDSKLIENLILSYLIGSGHLILLVIEQLTQSELEKIQVVKRLIRNSQKNPRLIIMHNFKQISKREHMEKKINNCLRKIFQFEEQPLFNDTKTLDGEGDIHKNLFKDEFGIIHLVTAAESTPAGEFYNRGPFKFLLSKIDMLENKETFSFCENFVEYCNTRLINLAGVDFALKCIDDKIFATNKQAKITPSALNYSANVFSQGEFDPKYSTKLEWLSGGDEARVIVEIEVLDSMIEKKALRVIEGYHYLTVAGTRKEIFSEEEKQKGNEGKMLLTKGTRREGNYVLDIRLIGVFMDRKPDLEVQEEDSEFGIKRITVEFVKPKEQMI
mgnify:FL=1